MYLLVEEANITAQRLYQKVGFSKVVQVMVERVIVIDGVPVTEKVWRDVLTYDV